MCVEWWPLRTTSMNVKEQQVFFVCFACYSCKSNIQFYRNISVALGRFHFSHSNAEWARKKLTSTPTFETHTNRVRCSLVVMLHQGHFINAKHYSLEPFFEYQISCNDRLLTLLSRTLLVFHYPSPINKLKVKIPAWKLHSRSDLLTVLKYPLLFRLLICHPNRHLFVLNVFFGVSL